jgi:hypothetical protein
MQIRSPPPLPNLKKQKTFREPNQHLMAESAIGLNRVRSPALNSVSLRLRNDVRIQLKRDSWVAVSQLCADGGNACALVNQRRSDTMSKRMEAREWNSQRQEQWAQLLFPQLVRREHASSAFANRSPWLFWR